MGAADDVGVCPERCPEHGRARVPRAVCGIRLRGLGNGCAHERAGRGMLPALLGLLLPLARLHRLLPLLSSVEAAALPLLLLRVLRRLHSRHTPL